MIFFRNGCDKTRVQTEYGNFKTLVRGTFQDKSFSALWQVMFTKDPYKEDFKVSIIIINNVYAILVGLTQKENTPRHAIYVMRVYFVIQ